MVVLSSNDGVIISRSNEVKALGVKMGEPYFRVRSFLESHETTVFSSNFQLYEEVSARVMSVLRRVTPAIEVYSVDEAFLEVPPSGRKSPIKWGGEVRAQVLRETGIPVSVGIAPSKTVAKLAADFAKKHEESGGVFPLLPDEKWDDVLGNVSVEDVWGIGRKWGDFLRRGGILTALRLRDAKEDWVEKHLGVRGLRTVWELRGVRCVAVEEREKPRKSIQSSRSFASPVRREEVLMEAVTEFALTAGRRLRIQNSMAESLSVSISTNRFRSPFYYKQVEIPLVFPTDSDIQFIRAATKGLTLIFKEGYAYEKAEVSLNRISSAASVQLGLFGRSEDRSSTLSRVADHLNQEVGRRLLQPAILMGGKEWCSRKDKHSGVCLEDLERLPLFSPK